MKEKVARETREKELAAEAAAKEAARKKAETAGQRAGTGAGGGFGARPSFLSYAKAGSTVFSTAPVSGVGGE
jgi:hypothetical protein